MQLKILLLKLGIKEVVWQKIVTNFQIQWNLSNPTHQGTRKMCQIVHDVRTCLI